MHVTIIIVQANDEDCTRFIKQHYFMLCHINYINYTIVNLFMKHIIIYFTKCIILFYFNIYIYIVCIYVSIKYIYS